MTPEKVIRRTPLLNHTAALCLAATLAIIVAPNALAEDGVTNIISVWSSYSGNYSVGTNGSFNALIITNAASFEVYGWGIIGNSATSSNNSAIVTGTGSWLVTDSDLHVGFDGSFNQLTFTTGGRWQGQDLYIGNRAGANNNTVLVTGVGSTANSSLWKPVFVGNYGSSNNLTIADGAWVSNYDAIIGANLGANNNSVVVTGKDASWTPVNRLIVGAAGTSLNTLTISNSATVWTTTGSIGFWNTTGFYGSDFDGSSSNFVLVTGAGSFWYNDSELIVGNGGIEQRLTITNGGVVFSPTGKIGRLPGKGDITSHNSVLVSGSGSIWSNNTLFVGYWSSSNSLSINDGGTVTAKYLQVGTNDFAGAYSNSVLVTGGNLFVTNAANTAALKVQCGSITLNTGTVVVNQLYLTNNASSVMTFTAGLLQSGGSSVSNGVTFTVGDGVQSATLDLLGGTHTFANGLKLNTNSSLIGSGGIFGNVTNFSIIAPGHSVGAINITGGLTLQGTAELDMELAGPGTNDVLDISGLLAASGGLRVTFANGYTGNAGDTFDLLNFGSLSGAFSQTNLPALGGGLYWNTSNLYTLGQIAIAGVPEPGVSALLALGLGMLARRRRRQAGPSAHSSHHAPRDVLFNKSSRGA